MTFSRGKRSNGPLVISLSAWVAFSTVKLHTVPISTG